MSQRCRDSNAQLAEIVYVDDSDIHGRGVFAARRILRDEYIGTYAGPRVKRNGIYVLWVYEEGKDAAAVGRSGRNMLRFLNHASNCNAAFDGFDLYAIRTIPRGKEITFDYLWDE